MDIYIIHVSNNVAREQHIKDQLSKIDLSGTFINEGDISDLNAEKLDQFFAGDMHDYTPQASCGYKHLSAMSRLVKGTSDYALILEDDIIFYANGRKILDQIEAEINRDRLHNFSYFS